MAQQMLILWLCLLRLLATTTRYCAFATVVSYDAPRYSINASDLVWSQDLESPLPYHFPDEKNVEDLFPTPDCNGIVLEEATVDSLQEAMSKGHLTSTKIALCYLQRMYQTNGYIKLVGYSCAVINSPLFCVCFVWISGHSRMNSFILLVLSSLEGNRCWGIFLHFPSLLHGFNRSCFKATLPSASVLSLSVR